MQSNFKLFALLRIDLTLTYECLQLKVFRLLSFLATFLHYISTDLN